MATELDYLREIRDLLRIIVKTKIPKETIDSDPDVLSVVEVKD